MGSVIRLFSFVAAVGVLAPPVYCQSIGGTYTVAFDRAKPIAITGLEFGDPSLNAFGTPSDEPSRVTIRAATGLGVFAAAVRTCISRGRLGKVVATYTNALHHVEYTIEFKKVSVVSVLLPGADLAQKTAGDLTWTLSAADEKFSYQLMKADGAELSEANKKRIEHAHDRMEALLWEQVKRKPWQAPAGQEATPNEIPFRLEVDGVSARGIVAIGPLSVEQNSNKDDDRVVYGPLAVTVDATRAGDFGRGSRSEKTAATATLTYYRVDESGRAVEIVATLKDVRFQLGEASQVAPTNTSITNILVKYASLDLKVE